MLHRRSAENQSGYKIIEQSDYRAVRLKRESGTSAVKPKNRAIVMLKTEK